MAILKRFLFFICFIFFVCMGMFYSNFSLEKYCSENLKIDDIKVYTSSLENEENLKNFSYIKNGNGMIIDTSENKLKNLLSNLKNFSGIECKFNGDIKSVLKKLNVRNIRKEKVNDIINFYGYIPNLENYILIDGLKYNIHISVNKENKKLGIPIIFGSY